MKFGKIALQAIYTTEFVFKSRLVRHYVISSLAGTAVTTLITKRNEDGTPSAEFSNVANCVIVSIITAYVLNDALDAILDQKDTENNETYLRRMEELERMYPTAR